MNIFAGDRARFGIEAVVEERSGGAVFGRFRFWAAGRSIGDWDDNSMLDASGRWLRDFATDQVDRVEPRLMCATPEQVFAEVFEPHFVCFWTDPGACHPRELVPLDSAWRLIVSHFGMSSFDMYGVVLLKGSAGEERLVWAHADERRFFEARLEPGEMERVATQFCALLDSAVAALFSSGK